MPDTTPQRLNAIKRLAYLPAYHLAGMDIVRDLLAMIDALEAQIRDLTKPEEDMKPAAQLEIRPCPRCGRGWWRFPSTPTICEYCQVEAKTNSAGTVSLP